MSDSPSLLVPLTIGLYLIVVLALGTLAMRRTRTAMDFFAAGRKLGVVFVGLAAMSSAFSGFVFLAGPGLTYDIGVGSLMIFVPAGITSALLCWTVAKRLRLISQLRSVVTIPGALGCRFDSRSVLGLSSVAVLCGSVAYLALQVTALGIVFESLFSTREALGAWSMPLMMMVGLSVIVVYSAAGGVLAGVYTDVFQGVLMMAASVAVFVYSLSAAGGAKAAMASIADSPAFGEAFLDPIGKIDVLGAFGFFFVFSVGTLGQPHVVHKFFMLADLRRLKHMPLVIGISQAACLMMWLGIGLAVPALVAQGRLAPLDRPDLATPRFLLEFTPDILSAVVFTAVVAAIMSTSDSILNIAAAAVVRDLPRSIGRSIDDEVYWGRVATCAVAATTLMLALAYGDLMALLGTFAFGVFAACLAPSLAIGLNWKRVGSRAATASIATGLLLSLGLEFLARQNVLPSLPGSPLLSAAVPSAAALAASTLVLVVVTLSSVPERELAEDISAALEA